MLGQLGNAVLIGRDLGFELVDAGGEVPQRSVGGRTIVRGFAQSRGECLVEFVIRQMQRSARLVLFVAGFGQSSGVLRGRQQPPVHPGCGTSGRGFLGLAAECRSRESNRRPPGKPSSSSARTIGGTGLSRFIKQSHSRGYDRYSVVHRNRDSANRRPL